MAARPRVTSRSARMRRRAVEQRGRISGVIRTARRTSPGPIVGRGLIPGVLVYRLVQQLPDGRGLKLVIGGRMISSRGSGTGCVQDPWKVLWRKKRTRQSGRRWGESEDIEIHVVVEPPESHGIRQQSCAVMPRDPRRCTASAPPAEPCRKRPGRRRRRLWPSRRRWRPRAVDVLPVGQQVIEGRPCKAKAACWLTGAL